MSLRLTSKKAELFNSFFSKHCSLMNKNSKLPANFTYLNEKRLENVIFSIDEIGNIMQGFDPNKVHGQDKISIRILKICGNSLDNTLEIIYNIVYKECLNSSLFSFERKKGNLR